MRVRERREGGGESPRGTAVSAGARARQTGPRGWGKAEAHARGDLRPAASVACLSVRCGGYGARLRGVRLRR
ncbi:unnamed protein product [Caretta caretta]